MWALTEHAKEQLEKRGFSPSLTLSQIERNEHRLAQVRSRYKRAYIILCRFNKELNRAGTRGDMLVASLSLDTNSVVTVMLKTKTNIDKAIRSGKIYLEAT